MCSTQRKALLGWRKPLLLLLALTLSLSVLSWLRPLGANDYDTRLDNAERLQRGLPALIPDPGLDACAYRHSQAMAARGTIWHDLNQTAYSCAGTWQGYGENVGMGPTIDAVHKAFMDSPEHRRNILEPLFNRIGTGVTEKNGTVYVTEIFVYRKVRRRAVQPYRPSTATRPPGGQSRRATPKLKPVPYPDAIPETVPMLLRMLAFYR